MNTNEFLGMFIGAMATVLGVGAVIVKPLINNAKVMTELNESIKALTTKFNTLRLIIMMIIRGYGHIMMNRMKC